MLQMDVSNWLELSGKALLTWLPTVLYQKDKGFRRYAVGVERALALWDAAQQEWADYISFLGRLLKVNLSPLSILRDRLAYTATCPGPAIASSRYTSHPP